MIGPVGKQIFANHSRTPKSTAALLCAPLPLLLLLLLVLVVDSAVLMVGSVVLGTLLPLCRWTGSCP